MLRITPSVPTRDRATLRLEGWITNDDVDLLEVEGRRLLAEVPCLEIDLHGVRFIDQQGIDLFKSWPRERLVLSGASTFVTALLAPHGLLASDGDRVCVFGENA